MPPDYPSSNLLAPPFTLRQLSYLVAAAEAGTIVGAAARMHVSPSAMSDAITELERLLGARLCVRRKSRGLTLTSAGVRAVEDARALLRGAQELYIALYSGNEELVGPMTVGCFPTLAPTVLPPLFSAFGRAHPGLDLQILEATQDRLVEQLDSGHVDVAFVYEYQLPGRARRAKLFELPPHILLAASHRLADEPTVRLADLIEEDFIMLDSPPSSEHTLSIFASQDLEPRIRHRTSNPEVVRALVGRGLGYGMLVQRHTDYSGAKGFPTVMKEIAPPVPPLSIDIIWSREFDPAARTQAVIEFARGVDWPHAPAPQPATSANATDRSR